MSFSAALGRVFLLLALAGLLSEHGSALDNKLALTPPMGWITWERFTCETDCKSHPDECISQRLIRSMADRLSQDGYLEAGYKYVNIDDCWMERERDPSSQELVPELQRFGGPSGMKALGDHLHRRGLLLGTYGDCGVKTCAGYPAQLKTEQNYEDNYFDIDAGSFAAWGIDSFKFDGCYINEFKAESICPKMAKAIEARKRPILIICEWPFYMLRLDFHANVNWTLATEACNVIRYYEDVVDSWKSILNIVDFTVRLQDVFKVHHGPGHWFDPDQLVIGNFGLSLEQARAQMAVWAVWAAPLYMSNDLRRIDPQMGRILKNKRLIGVNQDPMGVFGLMVGEQNDKPNATLQAFVKPVLPVKDGCPSFAVVYLNRQDLGFGQVGSFKVRDLLSGSALDVAAKRHQELKLSGPRVSLEHCVHRLTAPRKSSHNALSLPELFEKLSGRELSRKPSEPTVYFKLHDLIEDKPLGKISIEANLELWVNPTSARAVLLSEA